MVQIEITSYEKKEKETEKVSKIWHVYIGNNESGENIKLKLNEKQEWKIGDRIEIRKL